MKPFIGKSRTSLEKNHGRNSEGTSKIAGVGCHAPFSHFRIYSHPRVLQESHVHGLIIWVKGS